MSWEYIGKYIRHIRIHININISIYRTFSRQNPDSGHYKFASTKLSAAGAFFSVKKHVPGKSCLIMSINRMDPGPYGPGARPGPQKACFFTEKKAPAADSLVEANL